MKQIAKYEAARVALAEACRVDEVKSIRDKAAAMQEYARQARDGELIQWAADLRLRAERRAGALLREMAERGERDRGGRGRIGSRPETQLKHLGVTKSQSSRWQQLALLDDEQFDRRASAVKKKALLLVEATARERTELKKELRSERERALGAKQRALPQKRYGLIYADPEWQEEVWSRETGLDRAPENHYPTSSLADLCARDVASIAAADCVLALWRKSNNPHHALQVLTAWGFEFRSEVVWHKTGHLGTGRWFRNEHEVLWICARGNPPAPAPGTQWRSVIDAPVGPHSAKPETFCEMLEAYFPSLPKIELNRRGPPRPGWDAWGNESEIAA